MSDAARAVRLRPLQAVSSYAQPMFTEIRRNLVFWLAIAALAVPTLQQLAVHAWGKDQSAHAPIVLATAIWLFSHAYRDAAAVAVPPKWRATAIILVSCLALYAAARITGLLEVRALAAYLTAVTILFALGGWPMLRVLWFPIAYSAFLVPIPDTVIDVGTQPIKLAISSGVVELLEFFTYPVAQSGVSIFIGQFELLIAAACSGLNSLISLTAIGSFYVYLRRAATVRYTVVLVAAIVPIAVLANFIRVLVLVLITYHAGEATAQGFLHETSGMFLFVFSLAAIFGLDQLLSALWRPRADRG